MGSGYRGLSCIYRSRAWGMTSPGEGAVLRGRVVAGASVRRADIFSVPIRRNAGLGGSSLDGLPGFQVAQDNATTVL